MTKLILPVAGFLAALGYCFTAPGELMLIGLTIGTAAIESQFADDMTLVPAIAALGISALFVFCGMPYDDAAWCSAGVGSVVLWMIAPELLDKKQAMAVKKK